MKSFLDMKREILLECAVIATMVMSLGQVYGADKIVEMKEKSPIIQGKDRKTLSINGKQYKLVWSDEFSGPTLDKKKWSHRILGYGYAGQYLTGDCAYQDGQGSLVLAMCAYNKSGLLQKLKEQKQREIRKTPFRGQKKQIKKLTKQIERLSINKKNYIPATSHLKTNVDFLYGYHEVKFKIPNIPGPGLTFWFPAGKKGKGEVEIDVLEGCLYNKREKFCDYKASSIHWYSQTEKDAKGNNTNTRSFQLERRYSPEVINDIIQNQTTELKEHEKLKTRVIDRSIGNFIRYYTVKEDTRFFWDDGKWHTIALLWTRKEYVFYYDGLEVGRYDKGIRTVPVYAILWPRSWGNLATLSKKTNSDDPRKTPGKILIDYYRVYGNEDLGKVVFK